MPTYQYKCTQCAQPLEVVQKFSDAPLTECPACAGMLRKVFSPVGVVFKGSGFYKTDSRASTSGARNAEGKPAEDPSTADKPAADKAAGGGKGDATTSPKGSASTSGEATAASTGAAKAAPAADKVA